MEEASGTQQQAQPGAGSDSSGGPPATSAPAPTSIPIPAPSVNSAPTPSVSGSSGAGQLSKRRRGLGVVTPNACTECRKKRAKVSDSDLDIPSPRYEFLSP
ncbi:hypothetical protein CTA1_4549 [Colletotrichum tanaceti]|uniref:Uncharacterized protein n=1 Tax=Colletotrichum tanaceti TaxID=1306861 RepID=A0A4V6DGY2_9PEZI|nr:hypothetical protein CTA1_4549 [Colletotrichum tanaceti]